VTTYAETVQRSWIEPAEPERDHDRPRRRRWSQPTALVLAAIAAFQVVVALVPSYTRTAFEDEGLYVYFGHQMIAHILHGVPVATSPGSYFSGAPGLYPVVAAMADDVGGLAGARFVSTVLAVATMVGVWGIGVELYGRTAGLAGAALFATCGPVILLSHLATFDMLMLALVVGATCYGVRSARNSGLLSVAVVSALLATAFLVKYAAALYVPLVFATCAVAGWRRHRWLAVRQAVAGVALTAAVVAAVLATVGHALVPGIAQTTFDRQAMDWQSTSSMLATAWHWAGPWYLLGAVGGVLVLALWPGRRLVTVALLVTAVAGVAAQIRIHEGTSFNKHVAFGVAFAAPVAGAAVELLVMRYRARVNAGVGRAYRSDRPRARRWLPAMALVVAALVVLVPVGLRSAQASLTAWPDDSRLVQTLRAAIARNPDQPVLGEKPSPERYALASAVPPGHWADTYYFPYAGKTGVPAYQQALANGYFGTIYLTNTTDYGSVVQRWLADPKEKTYSLVAKVPRVLRGQVIGEWLVYSRTARP
jgi:4-amino-4-deoxy-L-arabinose transferase-like glycosyltransferase